MFLKPVRIGWSNRLNSEPNAKTVRTQQFSPSQFSSSKVRRHGFGVAQSPPSRSHLLRPVTSVAQQLSFVGTATSIMQQPSSLEGAPPLLEAVAQPVTSITRRRCLPSPTLPIACSVLEALKVPSSFQEFQNRTILRFCFSLSSRLCFSSSRKQLRAESPRKHAQTWNREFPVRLRFSFNKAPEAVFLTQIATNSNPRAQSEVKKFAHYDYNRKGTISAKDFAFSLVVAIDINHINKLLDRVKEMNDNSHLRNIKIAFQEFEAFAKLGKQLEFFSLAIFSYGKISGELTKSNFQRAASQVYGITIIDAVADIIFHVFDANRDGNLNADEFIKIIQRRESSVALEDIDHVYIPSYDSTTLLRSIANVTFMAKNPMPLFSRSHTIL
ncbi:hypothetical protein Ahy_B07g087717 [Arachis hypogaea]|uniref:EF-hand domain-containing protein n=1 Tax=Arachis hypogaea TaxID=3818 RepID=A0A444YCT7_ARAHY|nr:hypothetical protein Ahy_B07g087717 [Arachis hypogaea]